MQIKQGADVLTFDGRKAGQVSMIVIDPKTKEVTHLVVQKGFLLSEDKVIPIGLVDASAEDQVRLNADAGDFDAFPDFKETFYIPIEPEERDLAYPSGYTRTYVWYPPINAPQFGFADYPYRGDASDPYKEKTERNIPEDTVALKEGAKVYSEEGEHVGKIVRLFMDPRENRATHFLISKGLMLKESKLVPVTWVDSIQADEVHLSVGSNLLERLPEYKD